MAVEHFANTNIQILVSIYTGKNVYIHTYTPIYMFYHLQFRNYGEYTFFIDDTASSRSPISKSSQVNEENTFDFLLEEAKAKLRKRKV